MTLRPEPEPSLDAVQIVLRVITRDGTADVVLHHVYADIGTVEDAHFYASCDAAAYGGGSPPSPRALDEYLGRTLLGIARAQMKKQEAVDADPACAYPREKFCGLGLARDHWESSLKLALQQLRHPKPEPTDAPAIPVRTGIEGVTAVDQAGDHEVLTDG